MSENWAQNHATSGMSSLPTGQVWIFITFCIFSKVRPKLGKIDIDYQKLHDAFFKWQTKPRMTHHGDLYYEGKEFEIRYVHTYLQNLIESLK